MFGKTKKIEEKILDVDASMQGTMSFKDPVNLHINGRFEGTLDTKGILTVGEKAFVKANITGDEITIAGNVLGEIIGNKFVRIIPPARVDGNIRAPLIEIEKGAVLNGYCRMTDEIKAVPQGVDAGAPQAPKAPTELMSAEEAAKYLKIESSLLNEWASMGKIPSIKDGKVFYFDRSKIDEWIASERVK